VGKIVKEHIDIIREYLLSFDESVRDKIRSTISTTLLKYITIIESGFIKDGNIDKISREIDAVESIEDLLKLRNEYFNTLALISIDRGTNKDLDKITSSNNQIFQKLMNEMADNKSFEKDMSITIKLHQREEMEKRFKQLDEEDEFELSDKEIKTVITHLERESIKKRLEEVDKNEERAKIFKLITRYSVAAAVVGILIGGYYLSFFNKEELIDTPIVANIKIPYLIESTETNKSIIVDNSGRGFAKRSTTDDSILIQQNGLSKQIDTLQAIFDNLPMKGQKQTDSIQNQILNEIESLHVLLNTYTFNSSTKKVVLNLAKVTVIENIISIDPSNLSKFYINIRGKYYLIETNANPVILVPLTDKSLIEDLQRIEFLK
jgi:hypothetical protein